MFDLKHIMIFFLVAWSVIATEVSTSAPNENLPFHIYDRINSYFMDVSSSTRFRMTQRNLNQNLTLHPHILFHWFGRCSSMVDCEQEVIYKKYQNILDPNGDFKNIKIISNKDLIELLIKQRGFTPFNCHDYNYKYRHLRSQRPDIDPLAFCLIHNMVKCVQILQKRKFYLEQKSQLLSTRINPFIRNLPMAYMLSQFYRHRLISEELLTSMGFEKYFVIPFIQMIQNNIQSIRNLISQPYLSTNELNKYVAEQMVNLQPIDQSTMLETLEKACNSTSTDSGFLHFGVWMLNNHLNALSYSGFNDLMETLISSHSFNSSPDVLAVIVKEVLKTKFQMSESHKRRFFKRIFRDNSFLTNRKETFLEIVKYFPKDGPLIYQEIFSECNPAAFKLLKESNIFVHRNIGRSWRDLFSEFMKDQESNQLRKMEQLLLTSLDDVSKTYLYEISWFDVLRVLTPEDETRIGVFRKVLHYIKDANYKFFELKFFEASLDIHRGDRNMEWLVKLSGIVPKPYLLLSSLLSQDFQFSMEKSFELAIPFLENDDVKVDLLKKLQYHNKIERLSKMITDSISDPKMISY
ncbi:hypothetical protein O9G_003763 [Rozella allomycis CSF55]|uniref:Uncharacterized protein n=1 Tax=Rozella allomycis (strain CSF55) TaxID=988480 RepID=A0A075AUW1_ROZAC|nr:hypothetical protein O9G_003763 [Rozella allomycis CSF55]|eukprot:EPZ34043.1 hypothetical protein O9G_003763 [Rozella allomycis CSF55]